MKQANRPDSFVKIAVFVTKIRKSPSIFLLKICLALAGKSRMRIKRA